MSGTSMNSCMLRVREVGQLDSKLNAKKKPEIFGRRVGPTVLCHVGWGEGFHRG